MTISHSLLGQELNGSRRKQFANFAGSAVAFAHVSCFRKRQTLNIFIALFSAEVMANWS